MLGSVGNGVARQIADGPDEVHRRSVARAELARLGPGAVPEPYQFD